MHLSNLTAFIFASTEDGQALIFGGPIERNIVLPNPNWLKVRDEPEQRVWDLREKLAVQRITQRCSSHQYSLIRKRIETVSPAGLHPALINGFESEALRLFPDIGADAQKEYFKFISFLRERFDLTEEQQRNRRLSNYVDDIGPKLFVLVDGDFDLLPEIPSVYSAPEEWSSISWNVNNHMIGPILDVDEGELPRPIVFQDLEANFEALNSEQQALYFFHMSRMVLVFEAETLNTEAPYLKELIRLVLNGFVPF